MIGATAYGSDGEKIGKIGQIFLDTSTGQPEWVTVNTGMFGTSESFVPLANARAEGNRVEIGYPKDVVRNAPRIDADQQLSEDQEATLYSHYGIPEQRSGHEDESRPAGAVGHDTSGPTTDDAMTRSEEHLRVGTERREAGRARLRKYVVTEEEQVSVPVSREEVRVEREPVTESNRDAATSGPAISEEEHEVVLHEERPVVEKEATPVERVRLRPEEVSDEETVSGEVRKEHIEASIPDEDERHG